MFSVFIIVFVVMMVAVLIMAVGVMFGRAPIKGSCGGLGAVGVEKACGCVDMCKNEVNEQDRIAPDSLESDLKSNSSDIYHP